MVKDNPCDVCGTHGTPVSMDGVNLCADCNRVIDRQDHARAVEKLIEAYPGLKERRKKP